MNLFIKFEAISRLLYASICYTFFGLDCIEYEALIKYVLIVWISDDVLTANQLDIIGCNFWFVKS